MDETRAAHLVLQEKAHDRRTRIFSALLATESGLGTEGMTVVGGSAIEIYTEGDYVSGDLDLVVDSRPRVVAALKRWGFRDEGKLWSKQDWGIYPDVMQQRATGSRRLTEIISTPVGSFRISGVEDLIVKRIRESVAWQDRQEAFAQAVLLVKHTEANGIDWDYIEFYARREGWEKRLADLRRRAGIGAADNDRPSP
ncbi:MAG: hypothetical protein WB947_04695 [Thermoplasmata archaeon]